MLTKELDAELLAQHGLGLSAYEVLLHLAQAPEGRLRMSNLAESVLLSRSGLTRLVDRLAHGGLIERFECPSDARGAYAAITDAGLAKLAAARQTHLEGIRARFLERFSESELDQLASFWARVVAEDRLTDGSAC